MLAEEIKDSQDDSLPTWDENCEWVHWKDRVFPFVTFYLIHETTARLLNVLEIYPLRSGELKGKMSSYISEESDLLVHLLPGVSLEALMEAFYGAIAVKCYLLEEKESLRTRAVSHLKEIRGILHFDEFFQKGRSLLERKLCQEQAEVPAQVASLR